MATLQMLSERLLRLERQVVDLLPQTKDTQHLTQPSSNTPLDVAMLITASGGIDRVEDYKAKEIISDRFPTAASAMKVYNPSGVDASKHIVICGPTPTTVGKDTIHAEYGRAVLFPACMQLNIPFYNGQVREVSPTTMGQLVTALQHATTTILAMYSYPFMPYFQAAILLYHMANKSSARLVVINTHPISASDFSGGAKAIDNIPGSPYTQLTLRERITEVAAIICTAIGYHTRCGGIAWQWQGGEQTIEGMLQEVHRTLLTPVCTHYIAQHNIKAFEQELFQSMRSDAATVLQCIFSVAAIRQGMTTERVELDTATTLGRARGIVIGFVSSKILARNVPTAQHRSEMQPIIMFLNCLLERHGSNIDHDLLIS